MNLRKTASIFVFAAFPALAGLFFAAQTNLEKDTVKIPMAPGIIIPGEQGSGALSIIPADRGKQKIEYRNIFFGWGKKDQDKDKAELESGSDQDKADEEVSPDRDIPDTSPGDLDRASPDSDMDSSESSPSSPDESQGMDMGSPSTETNSGKLRYVTGGSTEGIGHDLGTGTPDKGSSKDQGNMIRDTDKSEDTEPESRSRQLDQLRFIM